MIEMKHLWIILGILFLIALFIFGIYGDKRVKENNRICQPFCVSKGWTYGEWIGNNNCECFDSLILKNEEVGL